MATKIEWTRGEDGRLGETWNPTLGCTRVSPGCDNCYAIRQSRIRSGNPHPAIAAAHAGLTEHRDSRLDWTGAVNLLPDRLDQPLRWRRPRRIFVDSLTDLFHDQVPDEYIARVWAVMAATPDHTYQLLTKRHGRMRSLLRSSTFRGDVQRHAPRYARKHVARWQGDDAAGAVARIVDSYWPLDNVWVGVSVEDQQRADLRIPALLDTPAAVRWISAEPLLGEVDAWPWLADRQPVTDPDEDAPDGAVVEGMERVGDHWVRRAGLDWIVVGGESGPDARPMHPTWARSLRDQCAAAGTPFLLKQRGEWTWDARPGDAWSSKPPTHWLNPDSQLVTDAEAEHIDTGGRFTGVWRVGKKAAGRELDGVVHDEYPAAAP